MKQELEEYSELNEMADEHGIVFFGQKYFKSFPVNEIAYKTGLGEEIFNRSLENETVTEMSKEADICVNELNPDKVFLNIGEVDIKTDGFDIDEFINSYEWLVYNIHTKTRADIYIVSVISDSPAAAEVNARLNELAKDKGIVFINAGTITGLGLHYLKLFDRLKCYMRRSPITFGEAFSY